MIQLIKKKTTKVKVRKIVFGIMNSSHHSMENLLCSTVCSKSGNLANKKNEGF